VPDPETVLGVILVIVVTGACLVGSIEFTEWRLRRSQRRREEALDDLGAKLDELRNALYKRGQHERGL
jgi:hypothetical protein